MNKNSIGLATEAPGLPAISPNALHMAERDRQIAALHMLSVLRWFLNGHEEALHGNEATTAFAGAFFGAFSGCILSALQSTENQAVDVFIASLIEQYPARLQELERATT